MILSTKSKFLIAKQMVKERRDRYRKKRYNRVRLSERISGIVIVGEKGIEDLWKEYMEKLMNEENEWDHGISPEVKEGPADCIKISEVVAALKKMKRHKAQCLLGLAAEMIQATGGIGTQRILDLCNGIVKEGCIPADWKSSMVLPIYKGKVTQ